MNFDKSEHQEICILINLSKNLSRTKGQNRWKIE